MVVEVLQFTCPPEKRDAFIQRDREVWTQGLMKWPAFIGKEVWTDPNDPTRVVLVIKLKSRELLQQISQEFCDEMDRAMGDLLMPFAGEVLDVPFPDPNYQPA